jgi:superfamily II DNA or RNA helicase
MLKNVEWSIDRDYKTGSENEPLQFYLEGLANSTEFNLLLGYFSSSAINLLSVGFATFISRGGKMKMVINHMLSDKDKEVIHKVEEGDTNDLKVFNLTDASILHRYLDEYDVHFFECLTYLISQKRIEIKVIKPKNGKGIAHYKSGVFSDGENNVGYKASCNFTLYGLSENLEELEAFLSWENGRSNKLIKKQLRLIDDYFNERDEDVDYLPSKDIEVVLKDRFGKKDINELLVQEEQLLRKKKSLMLSNSNVKKTMSNIYEKIETQIRAPRFPYPEGPREYQIEAYNNWVKNGKKGLFAMATGTGKTLTSCFCLIEEFKNSKVQKNIIVVPGIELINQWYDELKLCNFKTIIKWASNNSKLNTDIDFINLLMHDSNLKELNIVITYDSFVSDKFLNVFKNKLKDFIVIFDETHNMGADGFKRKLSKLDIDKTIGLSATPLRLWDENNENEFIEFFFNTKPPYTYSYNMEEAIKRGFLCKYHYEPFFVNFNNKEWEEYKKLTHQLHHTKEGEQINTRAALRRQLLKDQAANKDDAVVEIIKIMCNKDSYKNTLIYCPKGIDKEIEDRYIHILQDKINVNFSFINTATFLGETKGRDLLLKDFENEDVHMLLAIKCLDEGVNIPKTMNAIFIASGQNYREFVQRRGRVLRNYKTDNFKKEYADIYDIVVLPTINQFYNDRSIAERLIVSEFKRLYEFYNLSTDKLSTYNKIKTELAKYGLTEGYINTMVKNEITN